MSEIQRQAAQLSGSLASKPVSRALAAGPSPDLYTLHPETSVEPFQSHTSLWHMGSHDCACTVLAHTAPVVMLPIVSARSALPVGIHLPSASLTILSTLCSLEM